MAKQEQFGGERPEEKNETPPIVTEKKEPSERLLL
jgi:hypothetical protein